MPFPFDNLSTTSTNISGLWSKICMVELDHETALIVIESRIKFNH